MTGQPDPQQGAATLALVHHLPGGAQTPRQARALVADALATLPEATVALAQLLTSELVTNVVLHACTGLDLQIEIADSRARITVQDASAADPQPRASSAETSATGRGLAIVDGLASTWGWEPTSTGKRVWFELTSPSAESFGVGRTRGNR